MLHLAESCGHFWRPVPSQIDADIGVEHIAGAHHKPLRRCGCGSLRFFANMSAGKSASKSSTRTIPPAFSRNTISSPRRKISTSALLTRNFFGNLTAWLFPDLNTRAVANRRMDMSMRRKQTVSSLLREREHGERAAESGVVAQRCVATDRTETG